MINYIGLVDNNNIVHTSQIMKVSLMSFWNHCGEWMLLPWVPRGPYQGGLDPMQMVPAGWRDGTFPLLGRMARHIDATCIPQSWAPSVNELLPWPQA